MSQDLVRNDIINLIVGTHIRDSEVAEQLLAISSVF
jgi:hypothetical protein